jgi:hypothetical protein
VLAVVCGALLLCYPAVYNRYALVYTDSGTYLDSAITFHASWNRPFFYSLFLLGLHLRTSLWLIPLGQALIVTYLLHLVVASLFPTLGTLAFVFLMALLATFSSLPWFVPGRRGMHKRHVQNVVWSHHLLHGYPNVLPGPLLRRGHSDLPNHYSWWRLCIAVDVHWNRRLPPEP